MSVVKTRSLAVILILSLVVLLVGCSLPFIEQEEAADVGKERQERSDTASTAQTKSVDEQTKEADKKVEEEEGVAGPKLTLNLPDAITTDYQQLEVSGETDRNATVYVNGQAVKVKSDGTFKAKIDLQPGVNNVAVVAVDKNGQNTILERKVTFAVERPSLRVFAPAQSSAVNVTVSGYTDPECMVYINNQKVKTDRDGGFSDVVKITNPGANNIKVTAVNRYGLSSSQNVVVRGVPPRVQVAAPDMTTTNTATVSGATDPDSTVVILVGNQRVEVDNNNGTFSQQLNLEPGLNDVTVMATNIFGTTQKPLTILYDDYQY